MRPTRLNKGRVKWYDNTKGYGFICCDNNKEAFFHRSSMDDKTAKAIKCGDLVEFDLYESAFEAGRYSALHVSRI